MWHVINDVSVMWHNVTGRGPRWLNILYMNDHFTLNASIHMRKDQNTLVFFLPHSLFFFPLCDLCFTIWEKIQINVLLIETTRRKYIVVPFSLISISLKTWGTWWDLFYFNCQPSIFTTIVIGIVLKSFFFVDFFFLVVGFDVWIKHVLKAKSMDWEVGTCNPGWITVEAMTDVWSRSGSLCCGGDVSVRDAGFRVCFRLRLFHGGSACEVLCFI